MVFEIEIYMNKVLIGVVIIGEIFNLLYIIGVMYYSLFKRFIVVGVFVEFMGFF